MALLTLRSLSGAGGATTREAGMADIGFDGKVAIITGAGGGLGRQHALLLARAGRQGRGQRPRRRRRRHGRRRPARPSSVVEEIKAPAARPSPTPTRWPPPRAARPSCRPPLDAFGRVDIVINNAGILRDKAFHNMTPELLDPVHRRPPQGRLLRHPAGLGEHAGEGLRPGRQHRRRTPASSATSARPTTARPRWAWSASPTCWPSEGAKYNIKANAHRPDRQHPHDRGAARPARPTRSTPSWSRPVVAWLVHEDCPVTRRDLLGRRRRVARFFIGLTAGLLQAGPDRRGRARPLRGDPRRDRLLRPHRRRRRISSLAERLR